MYQCWSMYMYIYTSMSIYVSMLVYVHVHVHLHVNLCICASTYAHTHTCKHTSKQNTYTYMQTHQHVHLHMLIHIHVNTPANRGAEALEQALLVVSLVPEVRERYQHLCVRMHRSISSPASQVEGESAPDVCVCARTRVRACVRACVLRWCAARRRGGLSRKLKH